MTEYFVPTGASETELVEKRSRFLGRVWPVESEEEARARIEEIRKKHYDARHHCWCYRIREGGVERYSDDGEPQGTAGQPMLNVFQRQEVWNVCCIVTRYFGGVLLGAGGLVRAYTQGAVVALKAAQVVEMLPSCQYLCEVAYPLWDKVQYALKSLPVQLLSSEFTTAVGFTLLIRQTDAQSVLDTLTRVTDGRIETLLEEESYRVWDSESK